MTTSSLTGPRPFTSSNVTSISLGAYRTCGDLPAIVIGTTSTTREQRDEPDRQQELHLRLGDRRHAQVECLAVQQAHVQHVGNRREENEHLPQPAPARLLTRSRDVEPGAAQDGVHREGVEVAVGLELAAGDVVDATPVHEQGDQGRQDRPHREERKQGRHIRIPRWWSSSARASSLARPHAASTRALGLNAERSYIPTTMEGSVCCAGQSVARVTSCRVPPWTQARGPRSTAVP